MDKLYFGEHPSTSRKTKIVISALAVLAVVGVVATFAAFSSSSAPAYALQQYQIDEQEFFGFTARFNKVYESIYEFNQRFRIFRDNTAYARVHNTLGRSYSMGVTQFADLTHDEFKALYTPNQYQPDEVDPNVPVFVADESVSIPQTVDWRTQGAVTPVKNQGQCGSCWAFSTTGSTEGAWKIAGNALTSLSEQELVDCSGSYGNNGCNGGLMTNAFKYVMANGLTTESNYPYKAVQGKCQTGLVSNVATKIKSYSTVAPNNPTSLEAAVAMAPVSVAVEANQAAWQLYTGGIVSSDCGTALDHGVLIVGYNLASPAYWIVKNSWGASWGESGYIRIAISANAGVCGINMQPSYPTE